MSRRIGAADRPGYKPANQRGCDRHEYNQQEGALAQIVCPRALLHLPIFYDTLRTLDQTVPVDYYLPGCPPEADRIWDAVVAIVGNQLPPPGSVIGVQTTVCDECPRKRNEKKTKKFYRTWEIIPDEETCLLEQGLLCCGIATRAGCVPPVAPRSAPRASAATARTRASTITAPG